MSQPDKDMHDLVAAADSGPYSIPNSIPNSIPDCLPPIGGGILPKNEAKVNMDGEI
jgi:hypothetical protein